MAHYNQLQVKLLHTIYERNRWKYNLKTTDNQQLDCLHPQKLCSNEFTYVYFSIEKNGNF